MLAFEKELLLFAGYSNAEIDTMNRYEMTDEDIRASIREKLLDIVENSGSRQRVIPASL
jgi:hypothetical protein